MPKPGRSALVLPLPRVDPLLAEVAASYPHLVRAGLPAHLTVLYPFVPVDELDDSVVEACADLVRDRVPIAVTFPRCQVRAGMVYLPPEPAEHVQQLLDAVWASWPGHPPYGGKYADVSPHVSIALGAGEAEQSLVSRLVEPHLPIATTLSELHVAVLDDRGWSVRDRLLFGGR